MAEQNLDKSVGNAGGLDKSDEAAAASGGGDAGSGRALPATAAVRFEPDGGDFFNAVMLRLESSTPGAEVFYSLTPISDMHSLDVLTDSEKEQARSLTQSPAEHVGALQRAPDAKLWLHNDHAETLTQFRVNAIAFAPQCTASVVTTSKTFSISGIQRLEWDVTTATNGFASVGALQVEGGGGWRMENKTGLPRADGNVAALT